MGVLRPSEIRLLNIRVAIQASPHTENQRLAVVLSDGLQRIRYASEN